MQETVTYIETRQRGLFGKIALGLFVLFNLLMLAWLISYMSDISSLHSQSASNAERAGAALGGFMGTGMLLFIWTLGDLILGIVVFATRGKKVITAQTNDNAIQASRPKLMKYSIITIGIFLAVVILIALFKTDPTSQSASSQRDPNALPANWSFIDRTDPVNDTATKSLLIKSSNASNDSAYGLSIQCAAGEFDAFVIVPNTTTMSLKSDIDITTRIDTQQPQTSTWIVAADRHAAFHRDPKKFVQSLLNGKKLLIRFATVGHQEKLIELDIASLPKFIPNVAQACQINF